MALPLYGQYGSEVLTIGGKAFLGVAHHYRIWMTPKRQPGMDALHLRAPSFYCPEKLGK